MEKFFQTKSEEYRTKKFLKQAKFKALSSLVLTKYKCVYLSKLIISIVGFLKSNLLISTARNYTGISRIKHF